MVSLSKNTLGGKIMLSNKYMIWDETMFASTPDIEKVLSDIKSVRAEIKKLEKIQQDLQQVLYNYVGEHERIIDPMTGEELAEWKYTNGSLRFDAKKFQENNPGLAAEYMANVPGYRKLRIL
jgi:hypothetical protein